MSAPIVFEVEVDDDDIGMEVDDDDVNVVITDEEEKIIFATVPGQKGETGARGQHWHSGEGPPDEEIEGAQNGDFYLDILSGEIYELSD